LQITSAAQTTFFPGFSIASDLHIKHNLLPIPLNPLHVSLMLHASFLYSPPDAISDPHAYSAVFTPSLIHLEWLVTVNMV